MMLHNDTWQAIRDCIGCLKFVPNEPIICNVVTISIEKDSRWIFFVAGFNGVAGVYDLITYLHDCCFVSSTHLFV